MVEIFKTNVQTQTEASHIIDQLKNILSKASINFDLEDCDKILRVEGLSKSNIKTIIADVTRSGYLCELLN